MRNLFFTFFLLMIFNSVFGQAPAIVSTQQMEKVQKETPSKTIQSSNATGFLSYNNFAKLNATNNGVAAEGNINYIAKNAVNFSLNVSTPITAQTQQVKPLTIAGLSDNSSLTIGAQKIWWGNSFSYDKAAYNNAIAAVGGSVTDFNYDNLTRQQQIEFDKRAKINWGTAIYLGAKIGMEQQSFKYVANPVSFTAAEDSRTAFKGSFTGGMLNKWGILALTFTHKNGYVADDPVQYYIPVNNRGVQVERELSPTAPKHQNSEKLRFEYLSSGYTGSHLRVNPNLNVEFNQKLFSFELPVYFLTSDNEMANFNGGVYAGYVSNSNFTFATDKNNFGFGVFIGASFTNLFQ